MSENKEEKVLKDPKEILEAISKGTLRLMTPIRADGKDVEELHYDFTRLTGMEYVEALDQGDSGNAYKLSSRQALALFAAAAGKATDGIDSRDILDRINAMDTVKAVQIAVIFFNATARLGNSNISN